MSRERLIARFDRFCVGDWQDLIRQSSEWAEEASQATRRRRRRSIHSDQAAQRAMRAQNLVLLGEMSAGRQALEGAELAPGTQATLDALCDRERRPPVPREPLPYDLWTRGGEVDLDEAIFTKNVRSARRGAASGPSGMTFDHLRPLLDSTRDTHLLFLVAEILATAQVPPVIVSAIRQGRMTALQKRDGGVCGIVTGDALRRLVARTIAQQLTKAVEAHTAPFQYALSTRAGCECIAHALQALSDLNPATTITSIDGVGAFDLISRKAMLEELCKVPGGAEVMPFVLMFYRSPSAYLWEDDCGVAHRIHQGEGGEQGDPLMPLLFALGQHPALVAAQSRLESDKLMAFLDDVYIVSPEPDLVGIGYAVVQHELFHHAKI